MSRTVHDIFHLHTCARGSRLARDVLCERLHILQMSFCLVMFHRPWIDVPDFSSFCSTPPPPPTTSHSLMGTQQAPSATPRGGLLTGPLAKHNALAGCEPNSWVEDSSEHAPIHYPSSEHGLYAKSEHTATAAASENLGGFQQQAAASSSQRCVRQASGSCCDDSRGAAIPWVSADVRASIGKPLRGNESISSAERVVSTGKRDRDLDSVKIQSDRHSLYVYLEQKAEIAVQGDYSAQRRLAEAEADMDVRKWEMRRADLALHETNRELESQRLELNQSNRLADQAQRERTSLHGELEMRNRLFQESRARDGQEIEELRRFCSLEAEKARQSRIKEVSMNQGRSPSFVNQRMSETSGIAEQGEFLD